MLGCLPVHHPNWHQQDFCKVNPYSKLRVILKKTEQVTVHAHTGLEQNKGICLYIEIMLPLISHRTPCQASPHGSPPLTAQPGSREPKAAYKLLIAATMMKQTTN